MLHNIWVYRTTWYFMQLCNIRGGPRSVCCLWMIIVSYIHYLHSTFLSSWWKLYAKISSILFLLILRVHRYNEIHYISCGWQHTAFQIHWKCFHDIQYTKQLQACNDNIFTINSQFSLFNFSVFIKISSGQDTVVLSNK
jgi:hypothetical protein